MHLHSWFLFQLRARFLKSIKNTFLDGYNWILSACKEYSAVNIPVKMSWNGTIILNILLGSSMGGVTSSLFIPLFSSRTQCCGTSHCLHILLWSAPLTVWPTQTYSLHTQSNNSLLPASPLSSSKPITWPHSTWPATVIGINYLGPGFDDSCRTRCENLLDSSLVWKLLLVWSVGWRLGWNLLGSLLCSTHSGAAALVSHCWTFP
jgi:hypothetical protein